MKIIIVIMFWAISPSPIYASAVHACTTWSWAHLECVSCMLQLYMRVPHEAELTLSVFRACFSCTCVYHMKLSSPWVCFVYASAVHACTTWSWAHLECVSCMLQLYMRVPHEAELTLSVFRACFSCTCVYHMKLSSPWVCFVYASAVHACITWSWAHLECVSCMLQLYMRVSHEAELTLSVFRACFSCTCVYHMKLSSPWVCFVYASAVHACTTWSWAHLECVSCMLQLYMRVPHEAELTLSVFRACFSCTCVYHMKLSSPWVCFVCPCSPPEGNTEESARFAVHPNPDMKHTQIFVHSWCLNPVT